jgi:hypothetical protein
MLDSEKIDVAPAPDLIERVAIRILPDGSLDRENAAKYLGRAPKTLAGWKARGTGPRCTRDGSGRCWYQLSDLAAFKAAGEAA